jgi:hypothetical protein
MNSKRIVFTGILFIIFTFVITSCKKNDNPGKNDNNPIEKQMLKFENVSEFLKIRDQVSEIQCEEISFSKSQSGFSSFSQEVDEFYHSIDFESFQSQEELLNYVKNYPQYLRIDYDENTEIIINPVLSDNLYRIFVNEDLKFQIGDSVYKTYETVTLGTHLLNQDALNSIKEENIEQNLNDGSVFVFSKKEEIQLKDLNNNCGTWPEARATNGNDRTYLRLGVITGQYSYGTEQYVQYMVRPYKKTLGVWYWCTRTISCNIKVAAGYYIYNQSNSWVRLIGNYSNSGTSTSSLSGILCQQWVSIGENKDGNGHFDGYNAWADTPSTDPVLLQCNTYLVP